MIATLYDMATATVLMQKRLELSCYFKPKLWPALIEANTKGIYISMTPAKLLALKPENAMSRFVTNS
jgi:hypothetical protein